MSIIRIATLTILFILLAALPSQTSQATVLNAVEQFSCTNVIEIAQIECEALVALYNSTDGPNWDDKTGWLVTNTPCSWRGVECTIGRVTELGSPSSSSPSHLSGLRGNLPVEIDNLNNLQKLYLGNNLLSTVPPEIGNLSRLRELYLNDNQLSNIPAEIGNLTNLTRLELNSNLLSTVRPEIGNLTKLTTLDLRSNQLTDIPSTFINLINLSSFDIRYNRIVVTNSTTADFINSKNSVWQNTQTVAPSGLNASGFSTNMIQLAWTPIDTSNHGYYEISYALSANGPYTVHGITASKSSNHYIITGLAPNTIYHMRIRTYTSANSDNPNELWSDYSDIVSAMPLTPTLFDCTVVNEVPQIECEALVALYSETGGPLWRDTTGWLETNTPCSWFGVRCGGGRITELDLSGNALTPFGLQGDLPPEIENLTSLSRMDFAYNELSSLPAGISNLANLAEIFLDSNELNSLPAGIGSLSRLKSLYIWGNRLKDLPIEILNLPSLGSIPISHNRLAPSDERVVAMLDELDPDWAETQTVAPTDLSAAPTSEGNIELTWTPIRVGVGSYYEISTSDDDGDTFIVHGITASVRDGNYTIDGLSSNTTYNIRIRTFTSAHTIHPEGLWSCYSEVVSATTLDPPTSTPTATPTNRPTATNTATPTFTPTHTSPPPTATHTATPTDTPPSTPTPSPTLTPTHTSPPPTETHTATIAATLETPSPTDTPVPTDTPTHTPTATPSKTPIPTCYPLTLQQNGSGQIPTTSPTNSTNCPTDHYQPGEFIQLNAQPASDWRTQGWRGTDDNSRKTNFNTLTMPAADHEVTVIYTQLSPSIPVESLAVACPDITPPGEEQPTACLVGMAYVNGIPRADVEIEISSDSGTSATVRTIVRNYGREARPHYRFNLSDYPLRLESGQSITLRATYNGVQESRSWVVQPGRQQFDIVFATGETRPIATINHLPGKNFVQGSELRAYGTGQMQQAEGEITAYLWESDQDGVLGEGATLTYPINGLSGGNHQLSFRVQDSQGIWSAPAIEDIYVANSSQVDWLVLLYLAGDYHDGDKQWDVFQDVLNQLRHSVDNPEVRIVAQVDGLNKPAERWIIEPGQQVQAARLLQESIGEVPMDDPATLADFLRWGQAKYPAQHYYLVIADHGQGAQGIAWDTTSDLRDDGEQNYSAYLTVSELGQALDAPNVAPVDVLHLDACSMSMVEVAYEVGDRTQVLISSQYLGWDYFAYDQYIALIEENTTPTQLGQGIVETYSSLLEEDALPLPYTVSALDMRRSVVTLNALDALASELANRIRRGQMDITPLRSVRAAAQSFDSEGDFKNDQGDLYIDLKDWVMTLREELGETDATIDEMAEALENELEQFVLASRASSGHIDDVEVELANAGGVSIFYPQSSHHVTHQRYITHELFKFTRHSRWTSFLNAERGVTPPGIPLAPEPGPLGHLERDTDTPTPTMTATNSPTPTMTSTATPTPTATWTVTSSPTPTASPSATPTFMPTATSVPTSTPQPTAIATATATVVPTYTTTPTLTVAPIDTSVPTVTPQPTATATVVPTYTTMPTLTAAPTDTPVPTATSQPTATHTLTPTVTPTHTATPILNPIATSRASNEPKLYLPIIKK